MEAYKSVCYEKKGPKLIEENLEETICSEKNVLSSGCSFYIPVEVNKIKLNMLVDTGSPVTIISSDMIGMLGVRPSDLSRADKTLHTADGNQMNVKGKIKCKMKINDFSTEYPVVFAQLSKLSGIIGMDFLKDHNCDLKMSESNIIIDGQTVKLKCQKSDSCARIMLAESVSIPPKSEILIKGQIQGDCLDRYGLIESDFKIKQKGLLLARSLNNLIPEKEFYIPILNLNDKPVKLKKKLIVGNIECVDLIHDKTEFKLNDGGNENILPDHLQSLLDNTSQI